VAASLFKRTDGSGISPGRALSQALAGTLGVGNMTGVATAICQGGPGAVFWMWVSALVAMSIKYFEVGLAVKTRVSGKDGYSGGAMYYIKEIFSGRSPLIASAFAGLFALLCIANAWLTGTVIQINSAAAAFPSLPPLLVGCICAVFAFPVFLGRGKRASSVTLGLIPPLCALYILLSLIIIIPSLPRLPDVFADILQGAFSVRAAGGGVGGYLFVRAIRFGTTRGILSNEAGSGTSPTAHAEANTKSPHDQGCFGIFEVFADTVVLCTLTALVILLSDGCALGLSGISLTLYAFSAGAGPGAGVCIAVSALLFAYATVLSQVHYGSVALKFLTKSKAADVIYVILSTGFIILGSVISEGIMWQTADLCISLMTSLNVICLLFAEKAGYLKSILPSAGNKKRQP
ncbi:MAG: amino acid carrier protein, partial [Clostridia bacterium]|nr:amino acid carrier protein [Clostridia bacterium]